MNKIEETTGDVNQFLNRVYANLANAGIDVSDYSIDHIAYRAVTREDYDNLKEKLQLFGKLISEIIIRERPVGIIKLNKSLVYKGHNINYFEILAPAKGDTFNEGLEHAEFVIDIPLKNFLNKYSNIEFNTNSLNRKINPELIKKFEDGANVKFHEISIDKVIEIEQKQK